MNFDFSSKLNCLGNGATYTENDQDNSNIFNSFFTSLSSSSIKSVDKCLEFTANHFKNLFDISKLKITSSFDFKHTNEKQVSELINNLDSSSGPGCALISSKVIKSASQKITPLITSIFNKCIDEKTIPIDWKTAVITPLFKNKGDAEDINNYRGISVLPPFAKIFEKILATQIIEHLESNFVLTNDQHGFRTSHSCETALHQIISYMNEVLSKRQIA